MPARHLTRRALCAGASAWPALGGAAHAASVAGVSGTSRPPRPVAVAAASEPPRATAEQRAAVLGQGLADLERRHGGRLGVAVLDTARGTAVAQRGEERFPLCSTYKALAAAGVLARVDRGVEHLDRLVTYGSGDVVAYSPVTGPRVGPPGLTVAALCEAAVTVSDNTAGNLLVGCLGGPAGLTAWLRSLGDATTRLDRWETALNEATPGDPRDTTTPLAMARLLQRLVLGDTLSAPSRALLAAWLTGCRTGEKRLRAGAPAGWRVGDKTGGGGDNATHDIAVFWPPDAAPLIVTAYYVGAPIPDDARNAVLAAVGRLAAAYAA